ncbi:retrovirus-related pol polyprotein from transposon TNT 1-94 [Tanacetum coccineum]
MLAPKPSSSYNGRPSFANPKYLKKAQYGKPCLYEIPYDKDDLENIFSPDREETLTLEQESRSKLHKETVKPYDYTKQNSLYEIFKPPTREYLDHQPTIQGMNVLLKNLLIPLAIKSKNDGFQFETDLKQEMFADLEYVQSLEKEVDELESDKANFSNEYDILLQQYLSHDIMCSVLRSFENLDEKTDLQCSYLEKIEECEIYGTVQFGNDQFAAILGYGDLVQGNITIKRVYYVEGLNHNLFSVGQFCDTDLEVAFRKSTYFIRVIQGNDLLIGNRGSDHYTISLPETTLPAPICFMAKASPTQAWLWHHRLSHLNFDTINLLLRKVIVIGLPKLKYVKDQLCSSCEAKRSTFKTKTVPSSKG